MSIKLILTGGTIDKSYNEFNGELYFVDTYIPTILELGRNRSNIEIQQVVFKDSLDMTDADRQAIAEICTESTQNRILITHGTDTMVDTAKELAALSLNKTIVLVGAMIPYTLTHSDAVFNTGFALGALQALESGVYIAMNGTIFTWDNVIKNRLKGEFQTL